EDEIRFNHSRRALRSFSPCGRRWRGRSPRRMRGCVRRFQYQRSAFAAAYPSPGSHLRCDMAEASLRRPFTTAAKGGPCLSHRGRGAAVIVAENSSRESNLPRGRGVVTTELGRALLQAFATQKRDQRLHGGAEIAALAHQQIKILPEKR